MGYEPFIFIRKLPRKVALCPPIPYPVNRGDVIPKVGDFFGRSIIPGLLYNHNMDAAMQVPTIPERTRIPYTAIQSVVDQIVSGFHPQRIILFGSYAYGTPKPESDVDLLVVMETSLSETAQAVQIYRQLQYRFGLDLVLFTPQRLPSDSHGDLFLKEIAIPGDIAASRILLTA